MAIVPALCSAGVEKEFRAHTSFSTCFVLCVLGPAHLVAADFYEAGSSWISSKVSPVDFMSDIFVFKANEPRVLRAE